MKHLHVQIDNLSIYLSYTQTQKITVIFNAIALSTCYIATSAMSAHSPEEHNPAEDRMLFLSMKSFLALWGRLRVSQIRLL